MSLAKLAGLFIALSVFVALGSCKKERIVSPDIVALAPALAAPAKQAPNLALPLVSSGATWELASVLGKKTVLLAFFTTWCPHCKRSMPYLQELYEKNDFNNLEIIAIDIEEKPEQARAFVKKYGLKFSVLLAEDQGAFARNYPVRYLPTLYLIGRDGSLVKRYEGFHPSILDEVSRQISLSN